MPNEEQSRSLRSADIRVIMQQAFPFQGKATGKDGEIKRAPLPWMGFYAGEINHPPGLHRRHSNIYAARLPFKMEGYLLCGNK